MLQRGRKAKKAKTTRSLKPLEPLARLEPQQLHQALPQAPERLGWRGDVQLLAMDIDSPGLLAVDEDCDNNQPASLEEREEQTFDAHDGMSCIARIYFERRELGVPVGEVCARGLVRVGRREKGGRTVEKDEIGRAHV